jgi:Fe-S-cluster-containing hydrogenase component 2
VEALAIDRETMEVAFDQEKCVACGLCKMACPVNAMSGTSIDLEQ